MKIGELLSCYRLITKRTIRDISGETGISIATISRIENRKPVDKDTLLKIINWLFSDETELDITQKKENGS